MLDEEVGSRGVGTWMPLSLMVQARTSVFPTREWALNGKDERSCWQGQEGHLGLLMTLPGADPSGHNLGLLPVPNPLPGADRWELDSAPSHPSGQFSHWPQLVSTVPSLNRLAWSTVGV